MSFWLWGSLLGFAGGLGISYANYIISKAVLRRSPSKYASSTVLRQLLNIGYLVLLYFVAPYTLWKGIYLLIGGALGITLPMFFYTARLIKLSGELNRQKLPDGTPGEDGEAESNG